MDFNSSAPYETMRLSLDELEDEHVEGERMITVGRLRRALPDGTFIKASATEAYVHINSLIEAARKSGVIVPMGFGVIEEDEVDEISLQEMVIHVTYFFFYSQEFDRFYRVSISEDDWVSWGDFVLDSFEEVDLDDANGALAHEGAERYDMIPSAAQPQQTLFDSPPPSHVTGVSLQEDRLW